MWQIEMSMGDDAAYGNMQWHDGANEKEGGCMECFLSELMWLEEQFP